ncbi:uncharacterized protein TRIADDRAFT_57995 [Trichoplax adhaerens]|uniref:SH2 domain-containing protein n=1 Tax=Trichoplax adhaerens TaxID=10228 RepID=B3S2E5_TRIAD|nr:hypothetical protein TRIADDRAFT_57995 [Trichoplax adhaerens]EDV23402.1 hypothetical protein TRIADDRAFT_57995 [Trichoplax adhaerens]|eukprot:XP_002114312.1 hypothetical protein TRIADDRAFT_57995 [Trichoplax adhaerens]
MSQSKSVTQIRHYRIKKANEKYYISSTKLFPSLHELVKHHSVEYGSLCTTLSRSCGSRRKILILPPIPENPNFKSWEISHKSIKLVEKLGQGAFGMGRYVSL